MRAFVATAIRGDLPTASSWWLTDSSLTFARKPGAALDAAPRPLRVGETLRRYVAKRIAFAERSLMRRTFVRRRQFGVACPGGAEVLVHYRILTRELRADSRTDGIGEWDNDLKNCYGSIFWDAIDRSVAKHVPGALPWTRWCHSDEVRIILPGGDIHKAQRGAEQGDPLGPLYAAAVIADVAEAAATWAKTMLSWTPQSGASARFIIDAVHQMRTQLFDAASADVQLCLRTQHASIEHCFTTADTNGNNAAWDAKTLAHTPPSTAPAAAAAAASPAAPDPSQASLRCFDTWYLDDSFIRGRLLDGDLWLAALDAVGAAAGLERSTTKSSFRLTSDDDVVPPYTFATCVVKPWSDPVKFLGVSLADPASQFAAKCDEVAALHKQLANLDDPAIELILIRECADVSRITHLLRAIGPLLPQSDTLPNPIGRTQCPGFDVEPLERFDTVMRESVAQIVRCEVTDEAAQQASWGVKAGGLGLRPASTVALPAHVASLVEARPFVEWLCNQATAADVVATFDADSPHQRRCDEAVAQLLSADDDAGLPATLKLAIERAERNAKTLADSVIKDIRPAPEPPPPIYTLGSAPALIPDVGEGEPEQRRPANPSGAHLQHDLLKALDEREVRDVLEGLRGSSDPAAVARGLRLADIASKNSHHDWLWAINPAHGFVLSSDSFCSALRIRLGLPLASYVGALPCAECGGGVEADDLGRHALLCAKGKRTIGHNMLRNHVASLAHISDPCTRTEVSWASPIPVDGAIVGRQRPADILTTAAFIGGVGPAALDVGITTPFTAEASRAPHIDTLEAYRTKKLQQRDAGCKAVGWRYEPLIFSALGRAHDRTASIIHKLCHAASRAFGCVDPRRAEAAWWRNATTLLMERNARMIERCRPIVDPPPILGGVDDAKWDSVSPPRRRARVIRAEALVGGSAELPVQLSAQ
jgi:hypothetical protein